MKRVKGEFRVKMCEPSWVVGERGGFGEGSEVADLPGRENGSVRP